MFNAEQAIPKAWVQNAFRQTQRYIATENSRKPLRLGDVSVGEVLVPGA